MSTNGWTRSEKIALYSLLVAVIGILVVLLTVPEFRRAFRLDPERTKEHVPTLADTFNSKTSDQTPRPSPGGYIIFLYWFVTVHGYSNWQVSQIRVRKGQWVSVSASGAVIWDPIFPAVRPDGAFSASSLQHASDFPMSSAACGALIMKIGEMKYVVGSTFKIQSQNEGNIEFMVNDRIQALSDNSGSFEVEVNIGGT
jgi:hypothetical protein